MVLVSQMTHTDNTFASTGAAHEDLNTIKKGGALKLLSTFSRLFLKEVYVYKGTKLTLVTIS